ncbi:3'-5' exonuclease-like [Spinacia oleracea]|uniref:3'-5' exonuclease-like n=1 Tax=Spinacia oleracea TaxID=3562 RepID=A0A9R0JHS1_SPIOL|nr:3'-5' exonuclease-like [Spinacia oleracea]
MAFVSSKKRKFDSLSSNPISSSLNNVNNVTNNTTIHSVNFSGKSIETTVTSNADSITQWITQTSSLYSKGSNNLVVGLDVEWKPNRSKYMNNKAATLQLCIDTKCLIIQLIYLNSIPQSLRDFLNSTHEDLTFVGVEVGSDVAKLEREYGLTCSKVEDLYKASGSGGKRVGLKNLAWEVLGLVMWKPKYVTLSNWEARVLSNEQVEYACIDAYASYKIGHKLLVG